MKYSSEYRDPQLAKALVAAIARNVEGFDGQMTLMEVCGTHTMVSYQILTLFLVRGKEL